MSVVVRLDRSIYDRDAVDMARCAFSELGVCSIQVGEAVLEVQLEPSGTADAIELARHFTNYALAASLASRVEAES